MEQSQNSQPAPTSVKAIAPKTHKDGYSGSVTETIRGTYNDYAYRSSQRVDQLMINLEENYFVFD